jgi:uncharacterized protein YodC (DUF2158 family)
MIGRRMRSKGGGPTLFVQGLVSEAVVSCTWMNAMGQHKMATFALSGLEDLDRPSGYDQPLGALLGLGSPVILAALMQIIGFGANWKSTGL